MGSCLLRLPEDEGVTLSGPVTRRLLEQGDGDAALLYICLLRRRGAISMAQAAQELRWDARRTAAAEDKLRQMELLGPAQPERAGESQPSREPPTYQRQDVTDCLEKDGIFRALTAEVERKLGKRLSTPDLSMLLGLYDYLGLPPDVIFLLVGHCAERTARQYGPGRRPTMRQIEKEGYAWARRGLDTQERAAAYLRQYAQRQERMPSYMRALQLGDRAPAPSEEKYLLTWLDWGFPPETVALAYDRTMLRCHELKWGYLNGILKNWHGKGLHTPEEVETGDSAPERRSAGPQAPEAQSGASVDPRIAEMRRYMKKRGGGES